MADVKKVNKQTISIVDAVENNQGDRKVHTTSIEIYFDLIFRITFYFRLCAFSSLIKSASLTQHPFVKGPKQQQRVIHSPR
jgi:hypothetical protein